MTGLIDHLIIVPIVLPLLAAGAMLLINERRRRLKSAIGLLVIVALTATAFSLLHLAATSGAGGEDTARVYRLGDWAAPYGIVLVADRLSSLMLALASVLGLGAFAFAMTRWDRAGPRFHVLFLLLLMGVNGAFLTGDLFNLFVFFEVMLAASYGLLLHGSGERRIRAALGYIAVNLTASMFFLIGVSLIYGATGTLNMADLATRIAGLDMAERSLFETGAAILAIAFLVKAAAWPLGFWLPTAYAAAAPPVAAVFAILSKVGVYVVMRLSLLLFGDEAGLSAGFGLTWLLASGVLTIVFGSALVLTSRSLARAAGAAVMVSSGTVLAVLGAGDSEALAGVIFYLTGSTLAAGALYLTADILGRGRETVAPETPEPVFEDEYRDPFDDGEESEIGMVIPAAVAMAGGAFLLCVLLLAGTPPLAGFVGKVAIFSGLLDGQASVAGWVVIAVLTLSSFAVLIGLVRFGIEALWAPTDLPPPIIRAPEFAAVVAILAAAVALSVWGEPAVAYALNTADWLAEPQRYVTAVLGARP